MISAGISRLVFTDPLYFVWMYKRLTITGSRQDSVDLARNDSLNLMIHRIEGGNHEEDVYK